MLYYIIEKVEILHDNEHSSELLTFNLDLDLTEFSSFFVVIFCFAHVCVTPPFDSYGTVLFGHFLLFELELQRACPGLTGWVVVCRSSVFVCI